MKYSKPEITFVAAASGAIQGNLTKADPEFPDINYPDQAVCSPAAYEADE